MKNNGIFVIEDFKHPNYYENNKDIDHILIDEFLHNLKNKIISKSSIISQDEQINLINSIQEIKTHKGNLDDSDICFIKKN